MTNPQGPARVVFDGRVYALLIENNVISAFPHNLKMAAYGAMARINKMISESYVPRASAEKLVKALGEIADGHYDDCSVQCFSHITNSIKEALAEFRKEAGK